MTKEKHAQLDLSLDELLSSTRSVRKRLDFDKPVEMSVIEECLNLALQAPSGSNSQGWHFVVVTDKDKKSAIAEYYRQSFSNYVSSSHVPDKVHDTSADMAETQKRVLVSAKYLADNIQKTPCMLIPCIRDRADTPGLTSAHQASIFASIFPAVWSFMLAARARGLGSCLTTLHLSYEKEVADILDIPYEEIEQVALIPVAYTLGTDFKSGPRTPLENLLHTNSW
jgi:nitroreductase